MAELELCYRNLKPTTDVNSTHMSFASWRSSGWNIPPTQTANGENAYSSPVGAAYTNSVPAQTAAVMFRAREAEAFDSAWYWSSTEFVSGYGWLHYFGNGSQHDGPKTRRDCVRAVRRVLIEA